MFAVIYQFKFPGVSEAKVAAGFCSESLGGKIAEYDFLGLNILISKDGDLNIHVKFEDAKSLKKFEDDSEKLLGDLRNSFVFKENKVSVQRCLLGPTGRLSKSELLVGFILKLQNFKFQILSA